MISGRWDIVGGLDIHWMSSNDYYIMNWLNDGNKNNIIISCFIDVILNRLLLIIWYFCMKILVVCNLKYLKYIQSLSKMWINFDLVLFSYITIIFTDDLLFGLNI